MNMKKIIFAALAATTMLATPAFAAPTDSRDLDLSARVRTECSLENPNNVNLGSLSIIRTPGSDALTLDGNSAVEKQNIWASCNYATSLELVTTNGGLTSDNIDNNGPDAADFTDVIEYRMELRPSDATAWEPVVMRTAFEGPLGDVSQTSPGPFHDNAELNFQVLDEDNPLRPVADTYSDTVVINLGAV
jgi:type 1 fimbria pilin